jgi:hypothetical protein
MDEQLKEIKKRALKYSKECLATNKIQEEFIKKCLLDFLNNNIRVFELSEIVFGQEEITKYNILDILDWFVYGIDIPNCIEKFEKKKNANNFSNLLEAYFKDVLFLLQCQNTMIFPKGKLHTDISLTTLFAIAYFPKYASKMGNFLVSYLDEKNEKILNYSKAREYGLSSTLYLCGLLLADFGEMSLSTKVLRYCEKPHTAYAEVSKNLYELDRENVSTCINNLINFHLNNCKQDHTYAFNREYWQYFPIEVLSLLQLRFLKGLDNSFVNNPFIDDFLPFIYQPIPIKLNENTEALEARIIS